MRDILPDLAAWQARGTRFATGSVVRTWNSAPRGAGATMGVSERGEVVGSISGGCVEGAVYAVAEEVLATGIPQLLRYGVSDADAFEAGLTCGGTLEIFVQPAKGGFVDLSSLVADVSNAQPTAVITQVKHSSGGPRVPRVGHQVVLGPEGLRGSFGDPRLNHTVCDSARALLERATDGVIECGDDGTACREDNLFLVQTFAPAPRMIVFGAIDFARAVTKVGKFLNYRVTVCDARSTFATPARFPEADEVVVRWPHEYLRETEVDSRTVICVLTHDEKFDIPVLEAALREQVAYVGAMGSRRTHAHRLAALRERGVTDTELDHLHSPIGLDLGARTPEETAISVAAEIIANARGGNGTRLRDSNSAIHPTNDALRSELPVPATHVFG